MVSQAEWTSKGYHSVVPGLISFFKETTVWHPLSIICAQPIGKNKYLCAIRVNNLQCCSV